MIFRLLTFRATAFVGNFQATCIFAVNVGWKGVSSVVDERHSMAENRKK